MLTLLNVEQTIPNFDAAFIDTVRALGKHDRQQAATLHDGTVDRCRPCLAINGRTSGHVCLSHGHARVHLPRHLWIDLCALQCLTNLGPLLGRHVCFDGICLRNKRQSSWGEEVSRFWLSNQFANPAASILISCELRLDITDSASFCLGECGFNFCIGYSLRFGDGNGTIRIVVVFTTPTLHAARIEDALLCVPHEGLEVGIGKFHTKVTS